MQRVTTGLLWAALILALAGTIANTTWAFATVNGGNFALGALQAFAADLGLVALAATLAVRRAQGERATWLWAGVGVFVAVSIYASYLHSYAQAVAIDAPLAEARPILLGVFLPLMLFALVEVVSHARKAQPHDAPHAPEASAQAHDDAQTSKAPGETSKALDADWRIVAEGPAEPVHEAVSVPHVVAPDANHANGNGHHAQEDAKGGVCKKCGQAYTGNAGSHWTWDCPQNPNPRKRKGA